MSLLVTFEPYVPYRGGIIVVSLRKKSKVTQGVIPARGCNELQKNTAVITPASRPGRVFFPAARHGLQLLQYNVLLLERKAFYSTCLFNTVQRHNEISE